MGEYDHLLALGLDVVVHRDYRVDRGVGGGDPILEDEEDHTLGLLVFPLLCITLDKLVTALALDWGFSEWNPAVAMLIRSLGDQAGLFLAFLIQASCVFFLWYVTRKRKKVQERVLLSYGFFAFLVLLFNVSLLVVKGIQTISL